MAHVLQAVHSNHTAQRSIQHDPLHAKGLITHGFLMQCRLIEVEYAEIEDRKVRGQLQNVGAIERQVRSGDASPAVSSYIQLSCSHNRALSCHSLPLMWVVRDCNRISKTACFLSPSTVACMHDVCQGACYTDCDVLNCSTICFVYNAYWAQSVACLCTHGPWCRSCRSCWFVTPAGHSTPNCIPEEGQQENSDSAA